MSILVRRSSGLERVVCGELEMEMSALSGIMARRILLCMLFVLERNRELDG